MYGCQCMDCQFSDKDGNQGTESEPDLPAPVSPDMEDLPPPPPPDTLDINCDDVVRKIPGKSNDYKNYYT